MLCCRNVELFFDHDKRQTSRWDRRYWSGSVDMILSAKLERLAGFSVGNI
jgi:hypothetical protein